MRSAIIVALAAAASAASTPASLLKRQYHAAKPRLTADALKAHITAENLLAGSQKLQDFADAHPNNTRVIGSPGHNDTIYWLKSELEALDYYDVTLQTFSLVAMVSGQINAVIIDGANTTAGLLEYSASGAVTAPLVPVANLGCEASDYPAEVAGNVALISRGSCEFGLKSALAGSAGAAAAIIYNNAAGGFNGTLGVPPRPEGEYLPTVSISSELAATYLDAISGGATIDATIDVTTVVQNTSTSNVLATTRMGDHSNRLALGAHSDSVAAGPGINDDGSGTVGVLEVAKALSKYHVNNAVTFGFWSAEEEGLIGSTYYVENLPANESSQIRAYLNFDMIASPNYVFGVYDGDGDAFNISGPSGSTQIETFFEDFFESAGVNSTPTAFTGRSDYGPFLTANIPAGGLFTGAEVLKTEEEEEMFGGEAGVALDICYHAACDDITNLNMFAYELNSKAIAAAVATYATSWEGFPARNTTTVSRRSVVTDQMRKRKQPRHHGHRHGGCGHVPKASQ
ncbi:putative aminopeptidase Y [Decorospora gaudefroyi]|uniref:Peptide hydrolase n=1 Tax=Decorospora gaudefroyi TaxID=184978 RepID=A0A6A5KAU9_9PLEO|nr:putative aminopeptidase Y [Decorospora gaudefroyi]